VSSPPLAPTNERAAYHSYSNAEMKLHRWEFGRLEGVAQGEKMGRRHLGQSRRPEDVRVSSALPLMTDPRQQERIMVADLDYHVTEGLPANHIPGHVGEGGPFLPQALCLYR
jgi:hypothetical protein